LRANRIRSLLMQDMRPIFDQVDVYLTPTYAGSNLLITNLTGHPQVVVPNGFRSDHTPTSITFTGNLFGESATLAVAQAFQRHTDFHQRRPPLADADTPAPG
jgi:Asp-tRNA(Asn)/Glu-tRNA(Gln) amidotransferase A subunit family amidase